MRILILTQSARAKGIRQQTRACVVFLNCFSPQTIFFIRIFIFIYACEYYAQHYFGIHIHFQSGHQLHKNVLNTHFLDAYFICTCGGFTGGLLCEQSLSGGSSMQRSRRWLHVRVPGRPQWTGLQPGATHGKPLWCYCDAVVVVVVVDGTPELAYVCAVPSWFPFM